jgi:hypothetical protein
MVDLAGRKDMKIEEITVVDTLKAGAVNPCGAGGRSSGLIGNGSCYY